ncbi:hypothetical protein [Microcoleus sp. F4-D5]|uniref:hypothetical protein n=1 Tax=Microcoleus sp. F4-D5 TaxID=2818760 RepID=UPI002FD1DF5D
MPQRACQRGVSKVWGINSAIGLTNIASFFEGCRRIARQNFIKNILRAIGSNN